MISKRATRVGRTVTILASGCLVGTVASASQAQPIVDIPGLPGGDEADSTSPPSPQSDVFGVGAVDLHAAAENAAAIERRQARRAWERAHRSSGRMYTPTRNFTSTAHFGDPGGWSSGYHTGHDFAAPVGTPVYAALAGTVIDVGYEGAYGNAIRIRHHDAEIVTMYAHLSETDVRAGQEVLRGQRIGSIGVTGRTTGAHLHFEVREHGEPRNPLGYL